MRSGCSITCFAYTIKRHAVTSSNVYQAWAQTTTTCFHVNLIITLCHNSQQLACLVLQWQWDAITCKQHVSGVFQDGMQLNLLRKSQLILFLPMSFASPQSNNACQGGNAGRTSYMCLSSLSKYLLLSLLVNAI